MKVDGGGDLILLLAGLPTPELADVDGQVRTQLCRISKGTTSSIAGIESMPIISDLGPDRVVFEVAFDAYVSAMGVSISGDNQSFMDRD